MRCLWRATSSMSGWRIQFGCVLLRHLWRLLCPCQRRLHQVCLPTRLDMGLDLIYHRFWWFAFPSGWIVAQRARIADSWGVRSLAVRRCDGFRSSFPSWVFDDYKAYWSFWCVTLGANENFWYSFVGREVGFTERSDRWRRGQPGESCKDLNAIFVFFQGCLCKMWDVNYQNFMWYKILVF